MSFDALAWAARQNTGSSATKLVLLGLAECASRPEGFAFPSLAAIAEFSSLDRKTVIAALDRLEAAGFIRDTGRKVGQSQRIKVYQLLLEMVPKTEPSQKRDDPKNGEEIVPKTVLGISKGTSISGAKAPSRSRASTGFPDDQGFRVLCVQWAVAEMKWTAADAGMEYARFNDNALTHDRRYKDWLAAWRNWCRSPYCKTQPGGDWRSDPMKSGKPLKVVGTGKEPPKLEIRP